MVKKLWIIVLCTLMILTTSVDFNVVKAEDSIPSYIEVKFSSVRVRTGPGTNYDQLKVNGTYQYYKDGSILPVKGSVTNSKGELWYNVVYTVNNQKYDAYIRSDFVLLHNYTEDDEFELQLSIQNFPEDYKVYLRYLHELHPTWIFEAYHTGVEWDEIIAAENVKGRSLIDGYDLALRSRAPGCYDPETDQYIPLDGSHWFQANTKTIEYFVDPRNFLNDVNVFMFLKLSFNEVEGPELVQGVVDGTFMEGTVIEYEEDGVTVKSEKSYAEIFYEAGQQAGASPIYLATLARQEQGTSGSVAITGQEFTYNGKTYKGLYNFYNIGATSGTDNWKKGLIWANGGEDGTTKSTSYNRPWTTIEKSIIGGGLWITDGYINCGQDTMYYQKFNCVNRVYWYQYMTNVRAAYSQSGTMYSTYEENDALDAALTFSIPVYLNMPEKTALPTEIEGNEEPENPTPQDPIDDPTPQYSGNFFEDMNLTLVDGKYVLGFEKGFTYQQLTNIASQIDDKLSVTVLNGDNELGNYDILATGLKLVLENSEGKSEYTIVIRGDVNGDGKISSMDYVLIKVHIMEEKLISDKAQLLAADMNDDDKVTSMDYVRIKSLIMSE